MKMTISDLLEGLELPTPDLGEAPCDKEAVKMKTYEKIEKTENTKIHRRVPRAALVAAVLAVALLICAVPAVAVVAVPDAEGGWHSWWSGFKSLTGMDRQERMDMIQDLCQMGPEACETEDADGNVTFYNGDGTVRCVLTAEEYKQFRAEAQRRAYEKAVSATDKVDIASLPSVPHAVNELPVSQGTFEDFAFDNGGMVVLYPEIGDGWELKEGDLVTLTLRLEDETDTCNLAFYTFLDGDYVTDMSLNGVNAYTFQYEIPKDGIWNFALYHLSVAPAAFTGGTITIQCDSGTPVTVD